MKQTTNKSNTPGVHSSTVDGIDFYDTVFSESGLHEVIDFLKTHKKPIFQRVGCTIYYLGMSDFMGEFDSEEEMREYMSTLDSSQFPGNKEKQIPKVRGYFSYDGKNYVLLGAEHNFEENPEDTDYGYKGVIFDVKGFQKIGGAAQDTKKGVGKLL